MKRRDFIQYASSSFFLPFMLDGFTAKAHTQATTPFMQAMMEVADTTDNILVVIQLAGGNDGLNMVVPLDQYATYSASTFRGNIALTESKILKLKNTPETGLHPSMTGLQTLFEEGKLSIVHSAGYPAPSFSHFRASDIWFTGVDSNQLSTSGWLGRYMSDRHPNYPDNYPSTTNPDPLAIQISSISATVFNTSSITSAIAIQDPDAFARIVGDKPNITPGVLPDTAGGKYTAFIRQQQTSSFAYAGQLKNAAAKGKNLVTYPTNNSLADQLKIVSRLIHGGLQTKVYYVTLGGFDTHAAQVSTTDNNVGNHATLMQRLSQGITAFMDDLKAQGTQDKVVGMTFSEFGRRPFSNGTKGTDHGWASPLFVFGNAVKTQIIGKNPDLKSLKSADNIPLQNDFRTVYAAILKDWMGASESSVKSILLDKTFEPVPIFKNTKVLANEIENPLSDLNIFPNPAQIETTIQSEAFAKNNVEFSVTDVYGREFNTNPTRKSRTEMLLNVTNMPSGKYFVKIDTGAAPMVKALMVAR
ncbi:MAG: DUF1501 domain-containing protein [Arcicella sp.]|nr:DUF1501 domain-containing protein [Arcicella sp.]